MRRVLAIVLGLFLLLFTFVLAHDVNKKDNDDKTKSTNTNMSNVTSDQKTTGQMSEMKEHVVYTEDNIKWGGAPTGLPEGAQGAVLDGDPSKPDLFTVRVKFPDGYHIMPHSHSAQEHLTVISGTFRMGYGDKFDENNLTDVPTGGFAVMPKGVHHFAAAKGETVLQIHAMGPWDITYVNPSDDPRAQHAGTAK